MWNCTQCSRGFDDYRDAEAHAEDHLVTLSVPLDNVERHHVITALAYTAANFAKMAKSHAYAGPHNAGTRAAFRSNSRDYRELADKIKKAGSQ